MADRSIDERDRHDDTLGGLTACTEIQETLARLGVFARNLQTGEGFANELWRSFGYRPEQLTVQFLRTVIHDDDVGPTVRQYEQLLRGEISAFHATYRVRSSDGAWHWLTTTGRIVRWDKRGRPELYVGADIDITERRTVEEALERARRDAEEQAQEAEALRMAGAIVASTLEIERTVQLVLDQAQTVVPYDTATVGLLREDALEVIGGSGWEDMGAVVGLRVPYPGDNPHSRALQSRQALHVADLEKEFPRYSNISGQSIRSWLGVPLIVHGTVIGLLALDSASTGSFTQKHLRLATALGDHVAVALHNARLYEQTLELAMTDSLTGLATRRAFFMEADRVLERARRSSKPVSVLMADLDHFKTINDMHGHIRGDEAIRLAAGAAKDVLRRTDVIGRYGGEEFAVVLPDTGLEPALVIADRLREKVARITVPGTDFLMSISIGVNTVEAEESTRVDNVLDEADMALLEAKRRGRNRVEVFKGTGGDAGASGS